MTRGARFRLVALARRHAPSPNSPGGLTVHGIACIAAAAGAALALSAPAGAAPFFFRSGFGPEGGLANGNFLLLSAPKPLLTPYWLHIGTGIIGGQVPPSFDMELSRSGQVVREPATTALGGLGLACLAVARPRRIPRA